MKVILSNVNVIHPEQKMNLKGVDILLTNGKISKVDKVNEEDKKDAAEFDLNGKFIVPGFFDMHVHLREPGREDEETVVSGCDSAANGGFTGIACMPNTEPAIDSAEVVNLIVKQAASHIVDVSVISAATLGREGEFISPMAELYAAGVVGFSDDGTAIKTSAMLRRCLEYSKMYDLPIIEHCEDESLSGGAMNEGLNSTLLGLPPLPSISEDIIVSRDILMTDYVGGKLHIAHISTKRSVEMVREAKHKGIKITAEVTPHHFSLTDDEVKSYNTNTKMKPPLRSKADIDEILNGLKDGTIDCIASDHAPHSPEEKDAEFEKASYGIVGLETQVGLALSELYHKNILTLEQIIFKMAINPRKILNLSIPSFNIHENANFTILDLNEIWTFDISVSKSKSKNSPFNKKLMTGKAIGIINNQKMYLNNKIFEL